MATARGGLRPTETRLRRCRPRYTRSFGAARGIPATPAQRMERLWRGYPVGRFLPVAAPRRRAATRPPRRRAGRGGRAASFDDLVGADEQRSRHGETERLRGLEVDD